MKKRRRQRGEVGRLATTIRCGAAMLTALVIAWSCFLVSRMVMARNERGLRSLLDEGALQVAEPASLRAGAAPPPPPITRRTDRTKSERLLELADHAAVSVVPVKARAGRLRAYGERGCRGPTLLDKELELGTRGSMCEVRGGYGAVKSLQVEGPFELDFFSDCEGRSYTWTAYELDGCSNIYTFPRTRGFQAVGSMLNEPQIPPGLLAKQHVEQERGALVPVEMAPASTPRTKYRIIYSSESADYFSYQLWANYYGFLTSGQSSATWTRLMTCQKPDDLAARFATFTAKRSHYSMRYSPINKPDVITKWFASADRPTEEVMVVIDPDNWLLKDLTRWVDMVSPGQAVGHAAYYAGSSRAKKLWKRLCLKNCDAPLDMVGVPYIVHREDLAAIAPLWRDYSLKIKQIMESDSREASAFKKEYGSTGIEWAAEMFGYNYASAHAGVRHKVVRDLQVRDVDGDHSFEGNKNTPMIHMGRAWFPKDAKKEAAPWRHTEGKSFSMYGLQVWCKCNWTAAKVMPWPAPPGTRFQSYHTLRLMHDSVEAFGPIPDNKEFRPGGLDPRHHYHTSHP